MFGIIIFAECKQKLSQDSDKYALNYALVGLVSIKLKWAQDRI